jgi:hypothetical protein
MRFVYVRGCFAQNSLSFERDLLDIPVQQYSKLQSEE